MIRRIASLVSVLVLMVIMLPSLGIGAKSEMLTGYPRESALIDECGLYNDDPQTFSELDTYIKQKSQELNLNLIVFLSGNYRSETDAMVFADDSYDEIFGENTDGIFYYLDISGGSPANDWISTSGRAVLIYEDHLQSIFSSLDYYLPSSGQTVYPDDIKRAIMAYIGHIESYAHVKPSVFDYHYDPYKDTYAYYKHGEYCVTEPGKKPLIVYLKPFCMSALAGFLVSLISYLISKSRYKFKGSTDPKVYVSNNLTRFTQNQNIFVRKFTNRSRISSDSSGGSRSSGGGSHHSHSSHSHSGHHGGGGHHR